MATRTKLRRQLAQQLAARDARIAELEAELRDFQLPAIAPIEHDPFNFDKNLRPFSADDKAAKEMGE